MRSAFGIILLAGCATTPVAPVPTVTAVATVTTVETLPPGAPVEALVTAGGEPAPLQIAASPSGLRCPGPQRALAGAPVRLRAEGFAEGARLMWSVTRAPQARWYRFAPRFDPNDSDAVVAMGAEVPFTSVIVGDYTVRLDARDADGSTASCETTVSMLGHGLRVELSWDTDNTDVDLHMAQDPAARWFTPADCYFGNRRPEGSAEATPAARWLDVDDVDGRGPENIRVDVPRTDAEYRVAVHYYSSHGQSGATRAQVVVYCGEQRVAAFSRALRGDRGQDNDFWHVAGVRFTGDGGCAVRPVDRVVPRQAADSLGGALVAE